MRTGALPLPQVHRTAIIVTLALLAWWLGGFLAGRDIEAIRAVVILSGLVLVSLAVFWFASGSDRGGIMVFLVLFTAFALKLLSVAFFFVFHLLADATVYDKEGTYISHLLMNGLWPPGLKPWGTDFVRLLTGLVYTVTGRTFHGAFILWAWWGLLGMLFFYKAFVRAFPEGDRRLYFVLIFFYPSLLLWTSYLGKDAPMVLCLGMAAYGAARLHHRIEFAGVAWFILGSVGILLIRPHIAAIFACAVGAAALIRPIRAGALSPVIRLVEVLVLLAVGLAIAHFASTYVGLESLSAEDVSSYIEGVQGKTAVEGSAFVPPNPLDPLGFAQSIPTVVFRPFPWEVSNATGFAAAIEGVVLMALVLYRWRSVGGAFVQARRNSYLLFIVVFTLLFIFLFSAISNFGILVRERVQLVPFILMLIAYRTPRLPARPA